MATPHVARRSGAREGLGATTHLEGLSRRRRVAALVLVLVGLPALTAGLVAGRDALALDSVLLIYLLGVVVIAVIGGLVPAVLGAVGSFLLANWYLTPPYYTFQVEGQDRLIQLLVFLGVAGLVSVTVDIGARNLARGERHRIEARLLSRLTSSEIGATTPEGVLRQVRELFALNRVDLVDPTRSGAAPLASMGHEQGDDQTFEVCTASGLVVRGYRPLRFAEDMRMFRTLAETVARAWEERRLAGEASRAQQLVETDRVRAALLAAVSHDLRTPLSGIKAAVSTLRQDDIQWSKDDTEELLAAIETGTDRLTDLVTNLLAMSRIQAGAVSVQLGSTALDEVLGQALLHTDLRALRLEVPEDLPPVLTDPGLLERVLVNLLDNAARFSPATRPPTLRGRQQADAAVLLEVIDHGPGVPQEDWPQMFLPFQRLGDRDSQGGVGLGLAIARGLSVAVGAELTPDHTPGGGLTMCLRIPVSP